MDAFARHLRGTEEALCQCGCWGQGHDPPFDGPCKLCGPRLCPLYAKRRLLDQMLDVWELTPQEIGRLTRDADYRDRHVQAELDAELDEVLRYRPRMDPMTKGGR